MLCMTQSCAHGAGTDEIQSTASHLHIFQTKVIYTRVILTWNQLKDDVFLSNRIENNGY